ncbi:hypothetical protein MMC09_000459 [Bachmanniomyces sp. S44760]|nr:hypothetical protein [Bachmanniomyces sp. S44760]
MFFSTIAAVAAVAVAAVSAQDLSQIPSCALQPALAAFKSTGCGLTDFHCVCTDTSFLESLTPVITKACSCPDLAKTLQFAKSLCDSVQVPLQLPPLPTCSGSSSSPAPTSAATTLTSAAATSTATSSVGALISAISDGQPQAPGATASATAVASTAPLSTGSPSNQSSSVPFTGGAATYGAGFFSVVALVAAVGAFFAL